MNAHRHPEFYGQIGQEPQELITAALALLQGSICVMALDCRIARLAVLGGGIPFFVC
jgi:hypothetical protein